MTQDEVVDAFDRAEASREHSAAMAAELIRVGLLPERGGMHEWVGALWALMDDKTEEWKLMIPFFSARQI